MSNSPSVTISALEADGMTFSVPTVFAEGDIIMIQGSAVEGANGVRTVATVEARQAVPDLRAAVRRHRIPGRFRLRYQCQRQGRHCRSQDGPGRCQGAVQRC
ncbi:hypothetical protein [Stenotrophomonas phage CM2]